MAKRGVRTNLIGRKVTVHRWFERDLAWKDVEAEIVSAYYSGDQVLYTVLYADGKLEDKPIGYLTVKEAV